MPPKPPANLIRLAAAPPADDTPSADDTAADDASDEHSPDNPCVLVFNASDPSGASGLGADLLAMSSAGAHVCSVVTTALARDSAETFDHFPLDDDAVDAQARAVLEDMPVQLIKIGFLGSAANAAIVAAVCDDYEETPVVAYMPNLSWCDDDAIDDYLDAFRELILPQTTILVGHHSTLWRWLLPDWDSAQRSPSARDIARAAHEAGVAYTLVTGMPLPEQFVDNVLASPESVLLHEKFELFDAQFHGAGDTLSAVLSALLASGQDLVSATRESLHFLDRALDAGYRTGMGRMVPDRLFWAQADDADDADEPAEASPSGFDFPDPGNPSGTPH
jgi:hydroxymethylpyrimidine/phosphomethylpyrimidine kinase